MTYPRDVLLTCPQHGSAKAVEMGPQTVWRCATCGSVLAVQPISANTQVVIAPGILSEETVQGIPTERE